MKIIKATAASSSMIIAKEDYTQITSGPMSVTADKEDGIFLNGPVAFTSGVEAIKFAGIFKFNPMIMSGMPSTIMTPIPTLTIDMPVSGLKFASDFAIMLGSMAV